MELVKRVFAEATTTASEYLTVKNMVEQVSDVAMLKTRLQKCAQ